VVDVRDDAKVADPRRVVHAKTSITNAALFGCRGDAAVSQRNAGAPAAASRLEARDTYRRPQAAQQRQGEPKQQE